MIEWAFLVIQQGNLSYQPEDPLMPQDNSLHPRLGYDLRAPGPAVSPKLDMSYISVSTAQIEI